MTQKKLARSTVVNYDSEAEAAYCVTLQKDLKNDVAAAAAEGNVAFDRAGVGSDLLTGRIRFARRRFLKGGKKMRPGLLLSSGFLMVVVHGNTQQRPLGLWPPAGKRRRARARGAAAMLSGGAMEEVEKARAQRTTHQQQKPAEIPKTFISVAAEGYFCFTIRYPSKI